MADISTTLDNIIAHYKCGEASDTTRADSTVNALDLDVANTCAQVTGHIDTDAAEFVYASAEWLEIADADKGALDMQHASGDFSMSVWAYFTSLPSTHGGNDIGFMAVYKSTGGLTSYTFHHTAANKMQATVIDSSGNRCQFLADAATISTGELNTWIHYGMSFDLSAMTMVFYKNGSSVASTSNNSGTVSKAKDVALGFTLGHSNVAGSQYFDGRLQAATITSDVISGAEFSTIYNSGSGIPYEEAGSLIKSVNGVLRANIKSWNGVILE